MKPLRESLLVGVGGAALCLVAISLASCTTRTAPAPAAVASASPLASTSPLALATATRSPSPSLTPSPSPTIPIPPATEIPTETPTFELPSVPTEQLWFPASVPLVGFWGPPTALPTPPDTPAAYGLKPWSETAALDLAVSLMHYSFDDNIPKPFGEKRFDYQAGQEPIKLAAEEALLRYPATSLVIVLAGYHNGNMACGYSSYIYQWEKDHFECCVMC